MKEIFVKKLFDFHKSTSSTSKNNCKIIENNCKIFT